MELEDHLVVFIDLLGTRDAIGDASRSSQLLDLLVRLSILKGEFSFQSDPLPDGTSHRINLRPAISSFSDHIVMSMHLGEARRIARFNQLVVDRILLSHMQKYVASLAAAALQIGFLLRGGATIGKLYHREGVVFGEALVEAYKIESQTSVYPRVVASPKLIDPYWPVAVQRDDDGLHHLNYFDAIIFQAAPLGNANKLTADTKAWFDRAVRMIDEKLSELAKGGRLNELAKWSWFVRKWRASLQAKDVAQSLEAVGVSADALPSKDPLMPAKSA